MDCLPHLLHDITSVSHHQHHFRHIYNCTVESFIFVCINFRGFLWLGNTHFGGHFCLQICNLHILIYCLTLFSIWIQCLSAPLNLLKWVPHRYYHFTVHVYRLKIFNGFYPGEDKITLSETVKATMEKQDNSVHIFKCLFEKRD